MACFNRASARTLLVTVNCPRPKCTQIPTTQLITCTCTCAQTRLETALLDEAHSQSPPEVEPDDKAMALVTLGEESITGEGSSSISPSGKPHLSPTPGTQRRSRRRVDHFTPSSPMLRIPPRRPLPPLPSLSSPHFTNHHQPDRDPLRARARQHGEVSSYGDGEFDVTAASSYQVRRNAELKDSREVARAAARKAARVAAMKDAERRAAAMQHRAVRLAGAYGAPIKRKLGMPRSLSHGQVERSVIGGSFSTMPRFHSPSVTWSARPVGLRHAHRAQAASHARAGVLHESRPVEPRKPFATSAAELPSEEHTTPNEAADAENLHRPRRKSVTRSPAHAVPTSDEEPTCPIARKQYVAMVTAARKWPQLSPRSALAKEEAIQELAFLPEGVRFSPEISERDIARILHG